MDAAEFNRALADLTRRRQSLLESGLPECSWINAESASRGKMSAREVRAFAKACVKHMPTCSTCMARHEYIERAFGAEPVGASHESATANVPSQVRGVAIRVFMLAFLGAGVASQGMFHSSATWLLLVPALAIAFYPLLPGPWNRT